MKKAIAAIIALALCGCALTACSGKGEEKGTVPDLTGSWIETNTDSDAKMSAEITSDTIEVYWSADETRALYWSGTYVAPTKAGTYTWSSVNDHDKQIQHFSRPATTRKTSLTSRTAKLRLM